MTPTGSTASRSEHSRSRLDDCSPSRSRSVFATRPSSHDVDLAGLPELVVGGLDDVDAATLLESVVPAPLEPRVRDRIVAETRGNPLAILELPREMTYAEIASGLPPTSGLSSEIEGSYQRRLRSLPARTRQLLLIAAAEPFGDQVLIWRAAQSLSIGSDDASPTVESGLCVPGAAVMFRHPLVRSAVYRGATRDDRRAVHRALADVTSPDVAPDRHAWHRAHGAAGPDENVAVELEHAGGRALARGSPSAAAALLEQATRLTPDSTRRAAPCARCGAGAQPQRRLRACSRPVGPGESRRERRGSRAPRGPPARTGHVRDESQRRGSDTPPQRHQTTRAGRSRPRSSELSRSVLCGALRRSARERGHARGRRAAGATRAEAHVVRAGRVGPSPRRTRRVRHRRSGGRDRPAPALPRRLPRRCGVRARTAPLALAGVRGRSKHVGPPTVGLAFGSTPRDRPRHRAR